MKQTRLLEAEEIECRVGREGNTQGRAWCTLLLYKNARCDYRILDELYGTFGWKNSYETINGQLFCTIEVWDGDKKEWVAKQNVGTPSNAEAQKGAASDAFKRTAVTLGIGRELYSAPKDMFIWLQPKDLDKMGKVRRGAFCVGEIGYDNSGKINALTIIDMDGEIRYDLSRSKHLRPAAQQLNVTMEQAAKMAMQEQTAVKNQAQTAINTEAVMLEIRSAQSKAELLAIHKRYPQLHGDKAFMSMLTQRKGELS